MPRTPIPASENDPKAPHARAAAAAGTDGVRKKRRFRPGTVAVRDAIKQQRSTDFMIKRRPFSRIVRSVIKDLTNANWRFSETSILALHMSAEDFLHDYMRELAAAARHGKRQTPNRADCREARRRIFHPPGRGIADSLHYIVSKKVRERTLVMAKGVARCPTEATEDEK